MPETLTLEGDCGDALLALHRAWPERYPVLLDSAASGTPQGRYSILLGRPGERLVLDARGRVTGPCGPGRFLDRLDRWWLRERTQTASRCVPFSGGWFLLLGYELAGEIEPSVAMPPAPDGECSVAWRMQAAIVHDHLDGRTVAVAEDGGDEFAHQAARDLRAVSGHAPLVAMPTPTIEEDDPFRFLSAVERVKAHIAAGDIYQANISRAWRARIPGHWRPADIHARLRRSNPGPFAGIAALGGLTIVSSSPERLVSVRGRRVGTRPIAGTRPRLGKADFHAIQDLIGHPKERAEHIMLIDLERNDLGRLCEPGSVTVEELMTVESYAHVHHIVSEVCGWLRDGVTPGQVIHALFPGGTITGCPKVRCMQIISEIEGQGRGAYTGSMGYLDRDGGMDLNILIRTLSLREGQLVLRAGAGIVADSDPLRELDETRAKARGVLRAIGGGA